MDGGKGREEEFSQKHFLSFQTVFLTVNYCIQTHQINTINHSELIILLFLLFSIQQFKFSETFSLLYNNFFFFFLV